MAERTRGERLLAGWDALPGKDRRRLLRTIATIVSIIGQESARQRERLLTDKELAAWFGISTRTLYRWVLQDPDVLRSSVSGPTTPGKKPVRRWKVWEVEARWSGGRQKGPRQPRGKAVAS